MSASTWRHVFLNINLISARQFITCWQHVATPALLAGLVSGLQRRKVGIPEAQQANPRGMCTEKLSGHSTVSTIAGKIVTSRITPDNDNKQ
jgi:hypothetical protein